MAFRANLAVRVVIGIRLLHTFVHKRVARRRRRSGRKRLRKIIKTRGSFPNDDAALKAEPHVCGQAHTRHRRRRDSDRCPLRLIGHLVSRRVDQTASHRRSRLTMEQQI